MGVRVCLNHFHVYGYVETPKKNILSLTIKTFTVYTCKLVMTYILHVMTTNEIISVSLHCCKKFRFLWRIKSYIQNTNWFHHNRLE